MKWINVKDRLPVPEQRVFAYGQRCRDDGDPCAGSPFIVLEVDRMESRDFWIGDWDNSPPKIESGSAWHHKDGLKNVTHWVPVYEVVGTPEPPEGTE